MTPTGLPLWKAVLAENKKLRKELEMKTTQVTLLSQDLLEYKKLAIEHGQMIEAQKEKTKELQKLLLGLSLYFKEWESDDIWKKNLNDT